MKMSKIFNKKNLKVVASVGILSLGIYGLIKATPKVIKEENKKCNDIVEQAEEALITMPEQYTEEDKEADIELVTNQGVIKICSVVGMSLACTSYGIYTFNKCCKSDQ